MAMADPLYLGLDLSTQQLKGIVVNSGLKLIHEAIVDFDADLAKYGITKGVLSNPAEGEIFSPVAMLVEACDLLLERLKEKGANFAKLKCVSGAGMQHGTLFWSQEAESLLGHLDADKTLVEQLMPDSQSNDSNATDAGSGAFSHPHSPNWQDASTQEQCDAFDAYLGGPEHLAEVTGSKAHHRFSGPQIMRFRQKYPSHYKATTRISLVSSFLASLFLGRVAPMDISDVCGMNLWDIPSGAWHNGLLALCAGGEDAASELRTRLGDVSEDGGGSLGIISPYYVRRYGFNEDCAIAPFTGDNPSTLLSLPLFANDAIVSLGTSTTFLMSTPQYRPDPAYHFMNHPTTTGLYMFMLCYKNGGLAREQVRDKINSLRGRPDDKAWDLFNEAALSQPPMGVGDGERMKMGLYFPRPEIVPNVGAGEWHFTFDPTSQKIQQVEHPDREDSLSEAQAREIIESQMLSLRLRSANLVQGHGDLPAQPRRIYLVGGGSRNNAIAQICGEILGGWEGIYRLDIGGNACALGAAYKAAWAVERQERGKPDGGLPNDEPQAVRGKWESFEEFVGKRWKEDDFVRKICEGYNEERFGIYGRAMKGFEMMEKKVLEYESASKGLQKVEEKDVMGSAMSRERDPATGQKD